MVVEHRPKRSGPRTGPDLLEAASAVSEKVMQAAYDASHALKALGIRHAIVGGIAVGAYGAQRATKDVDFLVNQEDAFSGEAVLSFKPGVPIAIRGIAVDYLTPEGNEHVALLRKAVAEARARTARMSQASWFSWSQPPVRTPSSPSAISRSRPHGRFGRTAAPAASAAGKADSAGSSRCRRSTACSSRSRTRG